MLKIRMQRTGRTNDPSFRIVVGEHTASPRAGKHVDIVGSYDPITKARILNAEKIKHWLSVGAQASPTVHNMLISAGIVTGKKINVLPQKTNPNKKEEAPAEAASSAAPAPTEAPAA